MTDHQMPMFDEPPAATEPNPPKKPRQKPTRRKRRDSAKAKNLPAPKRGRPRKRRVAKSPLLAAPYGKSVASPFLPMAPQVSRLIGELMNLETPLRNFVMEVTKGLSK
jgi:hypothetical protein